MAGNEEVTWFLTFKNAKHEEEWWSSLRENHLHIVQIVGGVMGVFLSSVPLGFMTLYGTQSSSPGINLATIIPLLSFIAGAVGAVCKISGKHHDLVMWFTRLVVNPLATTFMQVMVCSADTQVSWTMLPSMLLSAFGVWRSLLDTIIFPLRFRHHLVVQSVAMLLRAAHNFQTCSSCLQSRVSAGLIGPACEVLGMFTIGTPVICDERDFVAVCVVFGWKIQALLGVLMPSLLVYKLEKYSRTAYLQARLSSSGSASAS
ncbi:unnamed protein product [Ostreobium quekettii]|uniref:Uncharacterized protein n=1 Tax=Ostreobium quekettii TaxID=121088 RepID=A0A8S1IM28_9CHLO|nr:unnamed protein product [Ostreobium quekettii]|eukprot:evm.model.scf_134.5 EVM.evm.TU.scf_134.5   scf_134:70786-71562(+)